MIADTFSRRDLLRSVSSGFGYLAFASLSSMAAGASRRIRRLRRRRRISRAPGE